MPLLPSSTVLDGNRREDRFRIGTGLCEGPTEIEGTHVMVIHYTDNVAAEALAIEGADCVLGIFLREVLQESEQGHES